jgi:hypothetical protein
MKIKVPVVDWHEVSIDKRQMLEVALVAISSATDVPVDAYIDRNGSLVEDTDWGSNRGGIETKVLRLPATEQDRAVATVVALLRAWAK